MKEKLEDFFQVVITEEKLRQAVHLNNRIRMSLKNLCDVMKLDPGTSDWRRYSEDGTWK